MEEDEEDDEEEEQDGQGTLVRFVVGFERQIPTTRSFSPRVLPQQQQTR